jgi:hypothetical protein
VDESEIAAPKYTMFADVRIVVEHGETLLEERSPYFFRFGYCAKELRWQPVDMIHVATVSGRSPVLIF